MTHYDCQFHWSINSFCSSHVNDVCYMILASFRSWDSRPLFLSLSFSYDRFFTSRYSPKDVLVKENFLKVNHRLLLCYRWGRCLPPFYATWPHLSFYIPAERTEHFLSSMFVFVIFVLIFKNIYNHSRIFLVISLALFSSKQNKRFRIPSGICREGTGAQQHQSSQYFHMARRIRSDKCRNNLH